MFTAVFQKSATIPYFDKVRGAEPLLITRQPVNQEIACAVWNLNLHHRLHNSLPLVLHAAEHWLRRQ